MAEEQNSGTAPQQQSAPQQTVATPPKPSPKKKKPRSLPGVTVHERKVLDANGQLVPEKPRKKVPQKS